MRFNLFPLFESVDETLVTIQMKAIQIDSTFTWYWVLLFVCKPVTAFTSMYEILVSEHWSESLHLFHVVLYVFYNLNLTFKSNDTP